MRLIDADDLIERINAVIEHGLADPDGLHPVSAEVVLETINVIPTATPEPHWIPVTERLPEESDQYLITVKYEHVDGYEDIYAEHGDWSGGKWDMFCFGHCGKVEDIVAWMPLPEPYKGVTE